MLKEFREFAWRGNVLDMAVGIVIGTAFGAVVKSLVADMLMPPIGLLLRGVRFADIFLVLKPGKTPGPYRTLADVQSAGGVTMNWGVFINTLVSFVIIALVLFMIVKAVNNMRRQEEGMPASEPTTKECPRCFSTISIKATRCANCTSEL